MIKCTTDPPLPPPPQARTGPLFLVQHAVHAVGMWQRVGAMCIGFAGLPLTQLVLMLALGEGSWRGPCGPRRVLRWQYGWSPGPARLAVTLGQGKGMIGGGGRAREHGSVCVALHMWGKELSWSDVQVALPPRFRSRQRHHRATCLRCPLHHVQGSHPRHAIMTCMRTLGRVCTCVSKGPGFAHPYTQQHLSM